MKNGNGKMEKAKRKEERVPPKWSSFPLLSNFVTTLEPKFSWKPQTFWTKKIPRRPFSLRRKLTKLFYRVKPKTSLFRNLKPLRPFPPRRQVGPPQRRRGPLPPPCMERDGLGSVKGWPLR